MHVRPSSVNPGPGLQRVKPRKSSPPPTSRRLAATNSSPRYCCHTCWEPPPPTVLGWPRLLGAKRVPGTGPGHLLLWHHGWLPLTPDFSAPIPSLPRTPEDTCETGRSSSGLRHPEPSWLMAKDLGTRKLVFNKASERGSKHLGAPAMGRAQVRTPLLGVRAAWCCGQDVTTAELRARTWPPGQPRRRGRRDLTCGHAGQLSFEERGAFGASRQRQ